MSANILQGLVAVLARELQGLCKVELTAEHCETIIKALLQELTSQYWKR